MKRLAQRSSTSAEETSATVVAGDEPPACEIHAEVRGQRAGEAAVLDHFSGGGGAFCEEVHCADADRDALRRTCSGRDALLARSAH